MQEKQFPKPSEMVKMFHPNNFEAQEESFKKHDQFDSNRKSNQSEDKKERDSSIKQRNDRLSNTINLESDRGRTSGNIEEKQRLKE